MEGGEEFWGRLKFLSVQLEPFQNLFKYFSGYDEPEKYSKFEIPPNSYNSEYHPSDDNHYPSDNQAEWPDKSKKIVWMVIGHPGQPGCPDDQETTCEKCEGHRYKYY